MTTNAADSKAVYTAVPLLDPANDEAVASRDESRQHEVAAPTSTEASSDALTTRAQRVKPFCFGLLIGILCYCFVDSNLLPAIPIANVLANSVATALMWSTVTSVLAYGIFWCTWSVLLQSHDQGGDVHKALQSEEFFEGMEYYYTLGVFLGFCCACTVDVILFGIPLMGVLTMVAVAFLWTLVMLRVAPPVADDEEAKGTNLPMVIV